MKLHPIIVSALLLATFSNGLRALEYPGTEPGQAGRSVADGRALLANAAIRSEWKLEAGRITSLTLELPGDIADPMTLGVIYPREREFAAGPLNIDHPINVTLQAFEVIVMELSTTITTRHQDRELFQP